MKPKGTINDVHLVLSTIGEATFAAWFQTPGYHQLLLETLMYFMSSCVFNISQNVVLSVIKCYCFINVMN